MYTVKIIQPKTQFKDGRRTCLRLNSIQSFRWRHPQMAAASAPKKRGTHYQRQPPQDASNTFCLSVLQCRAPPCMTGKTWWQSFPHGWRHWNKCERSAVVARSPIVTCMCECPCRKCTEHLPHPPHTTSPPCFFPEDERGELSSEGVGDTKGGADIRINTLWRMKHSGRPSAAL